MSDSDVRQRRRPTSLDLSARGMGDLAILILRLAAGIVLAYHGWLKLQDVGGFAGFVDSLNIPVPDIVAYLVTYLEFLGGIALILGVATRYVSALFAIEMVFTNVLVKFDVGLIATDGGVGAELDILVLAIALGLALVGAGRWSVDALLAGRRTGG